MNADRRIRLWSLVVDHAQGGPIVIDHVCAVVVKASGVDGGAVAVALTAAPREVIYASDRKAADLEELTVTVGEGPSVDAVAGSPVFVGDLATAQCLARWPVFAPAAASAGIRAVFALPLQVGAIRLGVLDLYRADPGDLDRDQLADALILADTACSLLLDAADHDHARRDGWFEQTGPQHPEVHQATGMITVQLGVTAPVALIRLRAYAYSHSRRLIDVAGDVVARRLRFDPEPDGPLAGQVEGHHAR